ncbi:Uncharacterized conserved protein, DUF2141 family [Psychroflexus sediminis]|uniref:Uncharacterized conserved protein, DUF2141 family n=2 Tax=Psychroflexus sediminis TaxID=470826 RepID=A0A1G7XIE6_9FLAO|nr:Uncharacterized conserved protein, DUF2141 family [Psychroflexus sediminis]
MTHFRMNSIKLLLANLLVISMHYTGLAQDISLNVIVEDIEENTGTIYLSLHDNAESFPSNNEKALRTAQIEKFDSTAEITFKNLKEGEYAISVFQDLNGNAKLDTNFIGIPKEPVGASKQTWFGRPKFSKCKFSLKKNSTISIEYMN